MTETERRQIAQFAKEVRNAVACKNPGKKERKVLRAVDGIDLVTGIITRDSAK